MILTRPRNRSSRPLTIDPRQISINSIDRLLALLATQLDSAPRRSIRSTWPTLYLILCICPGF